MRLFSVPEALVILLHAYNVSAKSVFAHYMVDNTNGFSATDWKTDMVIAQTVGIDAFALNIAAGSSINNAQIANAFTAANDAGFKLFFSFDYAGNGAWDKADVISLLTQYGGNGAYFQNGGPFVSTFEGPGSSDDWVDIKSSTGCFFMPDWSSLGAKAAMELSNGVADGLFSWAAWSWGGENMNTYTDASYEQYLSGKPYMMPAAGWFYTNLPGYDKNWMWPVLTMDLWEQRWTEIIYTQPEFVEIISWNDFGESHYVGPAKDSPPFTSGKATFDYVTGVSHEGWLRQLSVWAAMYKSGSATIENEMLSATYLINHIEDCSDGSTTVNTASQLQNEYLPGDVLGGSYYVAYTAMLSSEADVSLSVGGTAIEATWIYKPMNGVGAYRGYAYIGTQTGDVTVSLTRGGSTIGTLYGAAEPSIGGCTNGYANMNPVSVMTYLGGSVSGTTASVDDMVCTQGTGASGFADICGLTCKYGYCPIGACVCQQIGAQKTLPEATGELGYSKIDTNYIGLCSWTYTYGFKDNGAVTAYCSDTEITLGTPSTSPFLPDACTAGRSNGNYGGDDVNALCDFSCNYGWCPIHVCTCTSTGALHDLPAKDSSATSSIAEAYADNSYMKDLCTFACEYGYCPSDLCNVDAGGGGTGNDTNTDFPQRYGGSDPNCASQKPFFDHTYYVGNDQGGDSFCIAKWVDGIFPKQMYARANENSLCYLKITFTDNSEMEVGSLTGCGTDTHNRYGTLTWTPFVDTFSEFSLWAGGYNGGVGRLVAGITGGSTIDAGAYWADPPTEYPIPRGYDGKGLLMGFYGSAGDRIDSLEPIFSSYQPQKVVLTNSTFDPSYEALNSLPFSERKMSVVSSTAQTTNNLDQEYEMDVELWVGLQKQTAITFGSEKGHEIGGEVGATIGGEMEWKVGIPTVLQGKAKGEVSGKFVYKDVYKKIDSETDTELDTYNWITILKPSVPAGRTVECTLTAIQSSVSLDYTCDLELVFKDGNGYTYSASGVFLNTVASQVVSECSYVNTDGSADTSDYSPFYTYAYCPGTDETQVGAGDMDFDAFWQACEGDYSDS